MTVTVRPERAGDESAIATLTKAAFADAPHSDGTEADIVDRLRAAGVLTVSLVAEEGGAIVGHAAFSPVTISDGADGWFGLGPVSVDPAYQCRGIGKALIETGLATLRQNQAAGCVVLGEPGYYGRFGFRADGRVTLADVPPEYFQALRFTGDPPSGEVQYHPAFAG